MSGMGGDAFQGQAMSYGDMSIGDVTKLGMVGDVNYDEVKPIDDKDAARTAYDVVESSQGQSIDEPDPKEP